MRIIQICSPDADVYILDEVEELHQLFLSWGCQSLVNPVSWHEGDICLVHYIHQELPENLLDHNPEKLAVFLHQYYQEEDEEHFSLATSRDFKKRRNDLKNLVSRAAVSLGHSERACLLLEKLNAKRIRKVGHLLSAGNIAVEDEFTARMVDDGAINIFCYAPVNPDCGLDHVIKSFFLLEKFENPDNLKYRLIMAGDHENSEGWMVKIQDALKEISLEPQLYHVTGKITREKRNSFFNQASFYLNFDEFNLDGHSYVQALKRGIPVITSGRSIGSEILQEAPGVFDEIIHSAVAESLSKLVSDPSWREEYIKRQGQHRDDLGNDKTAFTLRSIFSRFE